MMDRCGSHIRVFLCVFLSVFLFLSHALECYAAPLYVSTVVVTPQSSGYISYTVDLPPYDCVIGGGTSQGATVGTYGYYNDTYTFDWYYRLGTIIYVNDKTFIRNYTPPSGCDTYVVTCSGLNASGVSTPTTFSGGSSGNTSLVVRPRVSVTGIVIDGVEYPYVNNFSSPYLPVGRLVSTDSLLVHCQISYVVSGYTSFNGVISCSNTPKVTLNLNRTSILWYEGGALSTSGDLSSQTSEITTGFDSSAGEQVSTDLKTGVDDYLKTEDEVFSDVSYDVPVLSVDDDDKPVIMLTSNFLQSLYISNPFISKCVTFVLTFGLVLYIVGFLRTHKS